MPQLPRPAARKPTPLSFLDLPTEIRSIVYNLSLVFPEEIILRPVFPESWPEDYKTFQSQLLIFNEDGIEGVGLFDDPISVTYDNPSKTHHPIELALMRTCKLVHDEAAHVLYTRNTFSFTSHLGWLAFLAFSKRLTKKHDLRSLQFGSVSMFSYHGNYIQLIDLNTPEGLGPPQVSITPHSFNFKSSIIEMKHRISELPITCHAALSIVNNLPGLNIAKLVVEEEITNQDCKSITDICQLLKNTHCALVPEKFMAFSKQRVPKIHASALAIFHHYGWTICGEHEVVEV